MTGVRYFNTCIKLLGFADDLILFANSVAEMNQAMVFLKRIMDRIKLQVNVGKCEVINFVTRKATRTNINITYDGSLIPQKTSVKYLGCILSDKDQHRVQIKEACSKLSREAAFIPYTLGKYKNV